ncbi:MAG: bifunctional [glutamate--ammonia ligase]-adenylyl-L-tyrosine phosphorylase/[glutamate--ammonia-ligase] adenylyltransferase [Burkholderiaceae bacterium]|nr:bifunctional [glutamate--ammonia ligase]-adenylyl-L-tyrosine phosphorylase/[glutamate--ammonia-ligase] adenylyltransferase [Burkholderiaceae bacterium]
MQFHGEQHSAWFRRALRSLSANLGEDAARARLAALARQPIDAAAIARLAAEVDVPGDMGAALRRARTWLLLGLLERDVGGVAPLEEVCAAMTTFAAFATAVALRTAAAELAARHGRPLDRQGRPQDLLAVGMGKAGGNELNVSSDLDLIFVYREDGETEGTDGDARRGRLASSEWMHRLARRAIELLAEYTADGFVFRVDTRLRPNGDSGPLVVSLGMLEQYFYAQGREWERFAWLKGRVIADSGLAGEAARRDDESALERVVTPFVFRRYMDYEAFAALRDLHAKIRGEVARRTTRDPGAIDVKLGRGGIREIEFIAQLFQIVRGGRDPALRSRGTVETLATLVDRGLLPAEESQALVQTYRLLRRTEHALQYREDAQTHRLPNDGIERDEAAAMLRMTRDEFDHAIAAGTEQVARVFDRLLAPEDSGEQPAPDAEAGENGLDAEVRRRFDAFRGGPRYGAARPETRASIERLLATAVQKRVGNAGLVRLVDLLDTVCRRPAYVTLLGKYPEAFGRVLRILDWAKWPADYLMQHPVVLDELLDDELLAQPDYESWSQQLRERVDAARHDGEPDVERQMDIVREAHHAQVFRLMTQDLAGRLTVERVSDHLSELADRVLGLAIELVWATLRLRFRDTPRFAAVAYGRLGGKELGYTSDLDLVFLYDDDDERAPEAYALLAQRLSGWLSARTAAGLLFEIDLRLRPNGAAGLLVSGLSAFDAYQHESAWVWEHQALTRARFSAGDRTIGERFETIRRAALSQRRDLAKLRDEVIAMRRKMHEGHPNRSELFDLKHDRGGMVDIEFLVQYPVLGHSCEHPTLLDNAGNIALLGRAAACGLIDAGLASRCADAYRRYRRLQHQLKLDDAPYARVAPAVIVAEREAVTALWEAVLG